MSKVLAGVGTRHQPRLFAVPTTTTAGTPPESTTTASASTAPPSRRGAAGSADLAAGPFDARVDEELQVEVAPGDAADAGGDAGGSVALNAEDAHQRPPV
jgi:hypothetical protein